MNLKSALLILAAVGSAPAHAVGHVADVQIFDRTSGRTLPVYRHHGRYYVAGEKGHEFQIEIANRAGRRVMAVGSVDGVNVVTGQTADTGQSGYVLSAWEDLSIAGWRKSLNHTAAFFFTRTGKSYAARTGRPDNVGVIAVAMFREREPEYRWYERDDRLQSESAAEAPPSVAGPANRAKSGRAEQQLGTGHGRIEDSRVSYTDFQRASDTPEEIVAIYYDSYENLRRQGIIPPRKSRGGRPNPFPGQFVPDP